MNSVQSSATANVSSRKWTYAMRYIMVIRSNKWKEIRLAPRRFSEMKLLSIKVTIPPRFSYLSSFINYKLATVTNLSAIKVNISDKFPDRGN